MTSEQLSGISTIITPYALSILSLFLVTGLIIALIRLKILSHKLRNNFQEVTALRIQLQDADEKQTTMTRQLQTLQTQLNHLEQLPPPSIEKTPSLPDFHAVMDRLHVELSRCARTQCSCAILFLHLDDFEFINTTWGQEAGEAFLHAVSSQLQQNTRTEDFIGNCERENFILLLVETDLAGAIQAAERMLSEISSHPYFYSTQETAPQTPLNITASIGIAAYGIHGTSSDALLQCAASAMHQVSNEGGNHLRVADIELETPSLTQQDCNDEQATINALTAAASAHHTETDDHAHRLVNLAEETAREIGCTEQEIRLVRLSALLHDIGKIGIPDAILDKPGPLTEEEWEIMRLHPQIGQHILCQAGGVFATLSHVIVAHHERWDGKGYPRGLAEHHIPIEARILTVVDAFDAMTSRRIYRQATSSEEARLELLRCAGSQFDPEVVIAFLRVLSRSLPIEPTEVSTQQNNAPPSFSAPVKKA